MGLFDFLNKPQGAPPIMNVMEDEQALLARLDPGNMSRGEKLSRLGQAMFAAGSGVEGAKLFQQMDEAERVRTEGIRDRFDRLQERRRQEARDKRSDYVADRSFNYGVGRDGRADFVTDRQFNYGVGRDKRTDFVDDRNFDRNVFTQNRDFNRGVLESDRNFGFNAERAVREDYNTDRLFNQRLNEFDQNVREYDDTQARLGKLDQKVDDQNVYYDTETEGIAGIPNIAVKRDDGTIGTISAGDPRYGYYNGMLKKKAEKEKVARLKGKAIAPDGSVLLPGQIAQDKAFGKELEKYRPAVAAANVSALRSISQALASGNTDAGGIADRTLSLVDPEGNLGLRAILAEEGLDTQQRVEGIIQQSLRETLGAQFTQQEAFRLISRAYNPRLSPEANSKRLAMAANVAERLIQMQQEKANHFRDNSGTLYGYEANLQPMIDQMAAQLSAVYGETEKGITSESNNNTGNGGTTSSGVKFSF